MVNFMLESVRWLWSNFLECKRRKSPLFASLLSLGPVRAPPLYFISSLPQYRYYIIGQELNRDENWESEWVSYPQHNEQLQPTAIKTNASTYFAYYA